MSNENNRVYACQSGYKDHNKNQIFFCNECFKLICLNCLMKHFIDNKHKNFQCYKEIKEIEFEVKNINDEITQNIDILKKIIENNERIKNYYEKIKEKNDEIFNNSEELNINNIIELKNTIEENKFIDLQLKIMNDTRNEIQKFESKLLQKKRNRKNDSIKDNNLKKSKSMGKVELEPENNINNNNNNFSNNLEKNKSMQENIKANSIYENINKNINNKNNKNNDNNNIINNNNENNINNQNNKNKKNNNDNNFKKNKNDSNNNNEFNLLQQESIKFSENNEKEEEFFFMNIITQLDNNNGKPFLNICNKNLTIIKEPLLPNALYNVFNSPPQVFPFYNAKQICFLNTLYITGGRINNSNTNQTFILNYDLNRKKINIQRFVPMNFNRELHSVIYVPKKNYLIICGGAKIKSCEYFNFNEKKWSLLPDLKNYRANATLLLINEYIIYILGGYNHENQIYEKGYEYLNLNIENTNWNFVNIFEDLCVCSMGAVVNNLKNEIILLGGFEGKKAYMNTSKKAILNDSGLITKIENQENIVINKGSVFYNCQQFLQFDENNFINFDLKGGFHQYNISNNKWLFIPPESN